jgi:drug/metabolite transporter (DMT)-like permease
MFAVFTALLWGFLAIALKVSLLDFDPITVVWFRFMMSSVCLFFIFLARRPKYLMILKRPPLLLILAGIGLGGNYIGYLKGIQMTTPSNAQVIIQFAPMLLALVGVLVYKEKMTWVQVVGYILAIGGFYLFYSDQFTKMGGNASYQTGVMWTIFGASSWVIYASLQKYLVRFHPPQSLNLIIYLVPAIALIPFVDFPGFLKLDFSSWMLMLFLGANTLLAYGALAEAFKNTEANKVGIIITLNPIITFIIMALLTVWEVSWITQEHFSWYGLLGAAFILGGAILAIVFGRKKKAAK